MTIGITATIMPGQGDAAGNHRLLIPRIAAHFPEVAKCSQFGTINVQFDQPFDRSRADFWTPHIAWIPAAMPGSPRAHRLEAFGFIRIGFECPLGAPSCVAWIMLPEGSELTYLPDRAEIIADHFVAGVAYGARCAIHIDHAPAVAAPAWFGEIYERSLKAN
jgi:hypothetical protein